jgi:hypothetical protein
MVIYQEGEATDLGPVRSTRFYWLYWANEYKAILGHFGGDPKTIFVDIPANAKNFYNMDGLRGQHCPYHRIKTRVTPYNVYTNTAIFRTCAAKLKFPATYQNMPTRPFRGDTPASQLPAAQSISIKYWQETIGYKFDPKTDSYQRLVNGAPDIDQANKKQVYARSIIVMTQPIGVHYYEPKRARRIVYNIGQGQATVFQEGKAIKASWKKDSMTGLTRFYDMNGAEIQLVRGEIFIQSVAPTFKVTVS